MIVTLAFAAVILALVVLFGAVADLSARLDRLEERLPPRDGLRIYRPEDRR